MLVQHQTNFGPIEFVDTRFLTFKNVYISTPLHETPPRTIDDYS